MRGCSFLQRPWIGRAGGVVAGTAPRCPRPKQIRQDPAVPWITVPAWGSGQIHRFEVKTLSDVRWLGSGNRNVRLVVIRPLSYRPRKGARRFSRDPGDLLCTGPERAVGKLLQSFLWRWE